MRKNPDDFNQAIRNLRARKERFSSMDEFWKAIKSERARIRMQDIKRGDAIRSKRQQVAA